MGWGRLFKKIPGVQSPVVTQIVFDKKHTVFAIYRKLYNGFDIIRF